VTDPTGPATGSTRVFRGGSGFYIASSCRSARRDKVIPVGGSNYGFRVVLSPFQP
jgi:formylglycine-generating enzyme required for sulfatase activity